MSDYSSALLFVAALLAAPPLLAASHCQIGETDYFSCQIRGTKKILSVCGSPDAAEAADARSSNAWLQYRFGRPHQIELTYPKHRSNSLTAFQAAHLMPIDDEGIRREIHSLHFDLGGVSYDVQVRDASRPFFGVAVTVKDRVTEYQCAGSFSSWQRRQGTSFSRLIVPLSR